MSKINYLVFILVLSIIGYVLIWQLETATETASQFMGIEVFEKMEIKLAESYRMLKRFPNSGVEFETQVLGRLDFSRYPFHIVVENFQPGGAIYPATFRVIIKSKTAVKPVALWMEYYGSEYQMDFRRKGKLERK